MTNQYFAQSKCLEHGCEFLEFDTTSNVGQAYKAGYTHWKKTGHKTAMEIGKYYVIGEGRHGRKNPKTNGI